MFSPVFSRQKASTAEIDSFIDESGDYVIESEEALNKLETFRERVQELNSRVEQSTESENLLAAALCDLIFPIVVTPFILPRSA